MTTSVPQPPAPSATSAGSVGDAATVVAATARGGDGLLWLAVACGVGIAAAAVIAQLAVLRRPLLTPLALGGLLGAIARLARLATGAEPRRRHVGAVAAVAVGAVALTYGLTLHGLRTAAAAYRAAHPDAVRSLQLLDQVDAAAPLNDAASGTAARRRRLVLDPRWNDYLAERSATFLGRAERPWPWLLAATELAGAALAAGWAFRRPTAATAAPTREA